MGGSPFFPSSTTPNRGVCEKRHLGGRKTHAHITMLTGLQKKNASNTVCLNRGSSKTAGTGPNVFPSRDPEVTVDQGGIRST